MKKVVIVLIVIFVFLLAGIIYLLANKSGRAFYSNLHPMTPTITSTQSQSITIFPHITPDDKKIAFCKTSSLQAVLALEGAAGSVYGTLTIKNTSTQNCQIIASNFVTPKYLATNITVANEGKSGTSTFILAPGQKVYTQVHYPNGPQCNGPAQQSIITFSYLISPNESVVFKDQSGKTEQSIMVCSSPSQETQVDVWSISSAPISG